MNRDLIAFGKIDVREKDNPGSIKILVERSNAELASFKLNDDATLAALIWNVSGRNELTIYDLKKNRVINQKINLPSEIAGGITFSKEWKIIGFRGFRGNNPTGYLDFEYGILSV